jgi:PadR family transcriptional regulator, regulatory protein PadR
MARELREPSFFVLAALLDGPRHGYGIIKRAEQLSEGSVKLAPGTLYGALDRLAGMGLIERDGHEIVDGRSRHYYKLTAPGRASLLAEAARLDRAARTVLQQAAALSVAT